MKFTIEKCISPSYQKQIEELLSHELPDLIAAWIKPGRELRIESGDDDAKGEKRVYLSFKAEDEDDNEVEVADVFCSQSEIFDKFPMVESLVPPPVVRKDFEMVVDEREEQFRERYDSLLGIEYNEELYDYESSLAQAVLGALALALSECAYTNFRHVSSEDFLDMVEDQEKAQELSNSYILVDSARSNAEQQMWVNACLYARLSDVERSSGSVATLN